MSTTISLFDLVLDRGFNSLASAMRSRARKKGRFTGLAVPVDDLIGVRLFSTGSFEQTQLDGVEALVQDLNLPPDAIFLDIGANIGVYSLHLSRYFAQVFAFEPNPVTFGYLNSNILGAGLGNTVPVNLGLSDTCGRSSIYVPTNGNLGWASLEPEHHEIDVRQMDVETQTLDEFVASRNLPGAQLGLIKVDVEGHEMSVLKGAQNTLAAFQPPLLCEVLSAGAGSDMLNYLRGLGYTQFSIFKRDISNPFSTRVVRKSIDPTALSKDALVVAQKM